MNKKHIPLIIFIIGIITLISSVVFLVVKLNIEPAPHDGDFLVSVGEWAEEDTPGVIWNFTEIGKGTLTTNNHLNDYDFKWMIEDGKLKVETDWLYTLDNEYEYTLDQRNNTLIIKNGEEEIKFTPLAN